MLSAKLVIDGEITLGMMVAISYIVGQLNGPITQLIGFMRDVQDARISLDRLGEIHKMEDEETPEDNKLKEIPEDASIYIKDLEFRYVGGLEPVLKDLSLTIPENKITAEIAENREIGKTLRSQRTRRFVISGESRRSINMRHY